MPSLANREGKVEREAQDNTATPENEIQAENAIFQLLSNGDILEEITTTVEAPEPYDIQIQGSDRPYPAIVLRRRHRGKGATIRTISKRDNSGRENPLYEDYADTIRDYLDNRQKRIGKKSASVASDESSVVEARERWIDKTISSVVGR